jgi:hypothetical protein
MKLNNKNEHPEEGKLVFLLNDDKRQGFVGVGVFKNGNWYTLPGEDLIDEIDFYWIDLIDQPERSKREDSYRVEFGSSSPISCMTSEGIKTMVPGKKYDENWNEI